MLILGTFKRSNVQMFNILPVIITVPRIKL